MSTLTKAKNPKARHAAGKCETLSIITDLVDLQSVVLRKGDVAVMIESTFDILSVEEDFAVVTLRHIKQISDEDESFSLRDMRQLFMLEENVERIIHSFRKGGISPDEKTPRYRISNEEEFRKWHEHHRIHFKNNDTQSELKSINGGLEDARSFTLVSKMLEAGYGYLSDKNRPSSTDLGTEFGLIFANEDDPNKAALLLKRL